MSVGLPESPDTSEADGPRLRGRFLFKQPLSRMCPSPRQELLAKVTRTNVPYCLYTPIARVVPSPTLHQGSHLAKRRKMSENERQLQKSHSPNHPPIHAALRGTPTPICPKAGPQPKMRPWPHFSDTNRTKNLFLATTTAAPSYELAAPQPHRPAMEPRHPTAALPRLRYGRVTLGRRTTRHQGWQAPLWWVLGGTSRTGLVSKKPVGFRLNPQ